MITYYLNNTHQSLPSIDHPLSKSSSLNDSLFNKSEELLSKINLNENKISFSKYLSVNFLISFDVEEHFSDGFITAVFPEEKILTKGLKRYNKG